MDDMFNEESVCKKCWNSDGDKTECSSVCKRREAYALHQPWYHIPPYQPWYHIPPNEMAQKQEDTIPAPIKEVAAKTWQEKYEYCSAATECLHCGKPKSKTNKLHAGLCKKTCSNRWRRNSILHPLYGEFISQNEIKMNWSKEKTQKIAAKKTLNGILDEALRNVGPSLDAAVKRIEARYNPVKEILDEEKRIEGRKDTEGKADYSFMPMHVLEAVARVFEGGSKKYGGRMTWMPGIKYSLLFSAIMRHLFDWFFKCVDKDAESGEHPLAHVCADVMMILSYLGNKKFDDRPKG